MQKKILIILLLIITFSGNISAQSFKELVKIGDLAYSERDFISATDYYRRAHTEKPQDIDVLNKYAETAFLIKDYVTAEQIFLKLKEADTEKKYPLTNVKLGLSQQSNQKYSAAKQSFKTFYDDNRDTDSYWVTKAELEIKACDYAIKEMNQEDTVNKVKIKHLNESVNSPYSEYAAMIMGDTALQFTSLRPDDMPQNTSGQIIPSIYLTKIYKSILEDGNYSNAEKVEETYNKSTKYHISNGAFSPDFKRFYFNLCTTTDPVKSMCDIYYTEHRNRQWQVPVRLDAVNMPGYTSIQPTIADDGENGHILFFVSDRPEGYGKLDIWYSRIKDGVVNPPTNIGNKINTFDDDVTPFYDIKNNILYFSSTGHQGLGNFDIFKSEGSIENLSTPVNLGRNYNTSYDDFYFNVNYTDESKGYLTSNRPGTITLHGETCCYDIFEHEKEVIKKPEPKDTTPEVVATTTETSTTTTTTTETTNQNTERTLIPDLLTKKEFLDTANIKNTVDKFFPITLYFHNDEPDPNTRKVKTQQNYRRTLDNYNILKERYKNEYSKGLIGEESNTAKKDIENFFDNYVATGFNKLEQFASLLLHDLQKGNDIMLTIKGFCSPLTTSDYNLNLSKRRISSLINFLREYNNGIFIKYINNGSLSFDEVPLGSDLAPKYVSDNPNDVRNSVYSIAAAMERKIQIAAYNYKRGDAKNAQQQTKRNIDQNIVFRIQIASSSKDYLSDSLQNAFSLREKLHVERQADAFKYLFGNFYNYKEAAGFNQNFLRTKGIASFVVAYQNEKRIDIREAIEKTK